ncbi:MAG: hypothetical protein ACFB2W_13750 [Leptolyngbyaceae cyanobacterium]
MSPVSRNPIYASKLAMAALEHSTLAWLDRSEAVMEHLSQELPLIDTEPLQALSQATTDDIPAITSRPQPKRVDRSQAAPRGLSQSSLQPSDSSGGSLGSQKPSRSSLFLDQDTKRKPLFSSKPSGLKQSLSQKEPTPQVQSPTEPSLREKTPEPKTPYPASGSTRQASRVQPGSQLAQLAAFSSDPSSVGEMPSPEGGTHPVNRPEVKPTAGSSHGVSQIEKLAPTLAVFNQTAEVSALPRVNAIEQIDQLTQQLLSPASHQTIAKNSAKDSQSAAQQLSPISGATSSGTVPGPFANALATKRQLQTEGSDSSARAVAVGPAVAPQQTQQRAAQLNSPASAPEPPIVALPPGAPIPAMAETLTDWVNDILKEQAHRHGVDLS